MYIAKRVLLVHDKIKKEDKRLELFFSMPIEDLSLQCFHVEVILSGFVDEVHNIAGVDSVDAVSLALRFAQRRIAHLSESYTLRWDDGSSYEPNANI